MQALVDERPGITHIILPESSYPFPLHEHAPALALLWVDTGATIIIGAQRVEQGRLLNTLFIVSQQCISDYYDKKLLMPFTEFLYYPWRACTGAKNLFLKESMEFYPQEAKSFIFKLGDTCSMQPLLCSELFLSGNPPLRATTLLCGINDSWFSMAIQRRWMFLYARYKAIEWSTDMLYIGHYHGAWISKQGHIIPL